MDVNKEECLKMECSKRRELIGKLIDEAPSFKKKIEPCIEIGLEMGIEPTLQCACTLIEQITKSNLRENKYEW